MNNTELITKCFTALNAFKRHRALANIKRGESKPDEAVIHDLRQYQMLDQLELGLRALQQQMYDNNKGETINVQEN